MPFPEISPEIFSVPLFGMNFSLRWYALAYIAGLFLGWRMVRGLAARPALWQEKQPPFNADQIERLFTWIILGVVLGGRLGFVIFYQPAYYLANPVDILRIWDGGMAFHGGFIGVIAAIFLFCHNEHIRLSALSDAIAYAAPIGIFFGRIANFINGELWGKPTEQPWGVVFPRFCHDPTRQFCDIAGEWFYLPGEPARHPSQLYEAGLEGLALGLILAYLIWRLHALKRPWLITGVFFTGYAAARIFVEVFREADAQFITAENPFGHRVGTAEIGLSMGQLLSMPMLCVGLALIFLALRRSKAA